jgi:hypothetical protein
MLLGTLFPLRSAQRVRPRFSRRLRLLVLCPAGGSPRWAMSTSASSIRACGPRPLLGRLPLTSWGRSIFPSSAIRSSTKPPNAAGRELGAFGLPSPCRSGTSRPVCAARGARHRRSVGGCGADSGAERGERVQGDLKLLGAAYQTRGGGAAAGSSAKQRPASPARCSSTSLLRGGSPPNAITVHRAHLFSLDYLLRRGGRRWWWSAGDYGEPPRRARGSLLLSQLAGPAIDFIEGSIVRWGTGSAAVLAGLSLFPRAAGAPAGGGVCSAFAVAWRASSPALFLFPSW